MHDGHSDQVLRSQFSSGRFVGPPPPRRFVGARGCYFFAVTIALTLAGIGSAAFGVTRVVLAVENSRRQSVRDYNDAVVAWTRSGRDAFEAASRATGCVVNGTSVALVPRNGTDDGEDDE